MSSLLPFIVVGITAGSLYGLAAVGLVLTYRTSSIFNFAHGAIGAGATFIFYTLWVQHGLPWPAAGFIAVFVVSPLFGLVLERMAAALAGASAASKIVATVGLQVAITGLIAAVYGPAARNMPHFLPSGTFSVAGVNIGYDQLTSILIAFAGAMGLTALLRFTLVGVHMRAVVDNPDLLGLAGTSSAAVRRWSWGIGCVFAALSGILLVPELGLDPTLLTLLVVQAFGAAAVGLFSSLPLTYAGGLLVGVVAALIEKFAGSSSVWISLPPAVPFLVLFVVLLVVPPRKLVEVGQFRTVVKRPRPRPIRQQLVAAVPLVAVAAAVPDLVGTHLPVYTEAAIFVVIFQSLNLLVRTAGQVSLAQAAFAGLGAATFAHLAVGQHLPWLVAVLLAGLVAVPVSVLVAIPAIRLSGLYLALATLGFSLLMQDVVYNLSFVYGFVGQLRTPRPAALGFGTDRGYYYLCLIFAVGACLLVETVARNRLGRLLHGLADSPISLSVMGLTVSVTQVVVFGLCAFIAAIGGALLGGLQHTTGSNSFDTLTSLTWLAVLVVAGRGRQSAPIVAALLFTVPALYLQGTAFSSYLPVFFGVGAILNSIYGDRIGSTSVNEKAISPRAVSRAARGIGAAWPEGRSRPLVPIVASPLGGRRVRHTEVPSR